MRTAVSKQELERGLRLMREADRVDRRSFLRTLGGVAAGTVLGGLGCGGEGGGATGTPPASARIEGVVVDASGAPQPSLGRIFLMYADGRMTGRYVDVDPSGKFAFEVTPGSWQLRFHAPRVAHVWEADEGGPADAENPARVTVQANETARVRFPIERSELDSMDIEIYIGDDVFYEVPFGTEGGTTTVKIGTLVCWYNVGLHVHNVTGGPWRTSGDMQKSAAFEWKADEVGTFPYRCTRHEPGMRATLVVTP